MAQRILRPLSYGDLFDELFDLYKKHFLLFAGIAGVVYIPVYLLSFALASRENASILTVILLMPGSYLVLAATTWAVSKCYLGEPVSIKEAYQGVGIKWLGLFGTMLLASIFILLGSMACIVPGVILAFRYAFLSEVYILEGLHGKDCRLRSTALAKGNVLRIFLIGLLAGILVQIITLVLTLPVELATQFGASPATASAAFSPYGVLYGLMQGLAVTIAGPISIIALILLYYDIRVRQEGFDIAMLANSMGAASPAPTANETTPVE